MKKLSFITILMLSMLFTTSCVQSTKQVTVHFQVDMNEVENVSSVALIGGYNPLRWNKKTALSDRDSNGIYDTTLTFDMPYKFLEFKFVLNGNDIELERQDNRRVYFEEGNTFTYLATFNKIEKP